MSITFEDFTTTNYRGTGRPMKLSGDLREVPHVGPAAVPQLNDRNIYASYQLIAEFLRLGRNVEEFETFLGLVGVSAGVHCREAARAIATRVAVVGVRVEVEVPKMIDGRPVSSKLTDVKAEEIVQLRFNNDLRHDFPGCGFGKETDKVENASVLKLRANGIDTTDQLFGAMLTCFDSPPSVDHIATFWKTLGDLGCSHGYKTTIIEAMKLKLDVGIDNYGRPIGMPAVGEEPSAAYADPQSAQAQRTRSRLPAAGGEQLRQPTELMLAREREQPKKGFSAGFKMGVAIVAVALLYSFVASPAGPAKQAVGLGGEDVF
jgi:hypothetical protein